MQIIAIVYSSIPRSFIVVDRPSDLCETMGTPSTQYPYKATDKASLQSLSEGQMTRKLLR